MSTATAPGVRYVQRPYDPSRVFAFFNGEDEYLSPADRHEVIRRLARAGTNRRTIADLVGCSIYTVDRAAKGIVR